MKEPKPARAAQRRRRIALDPTAGQAVELRAYLEALARPASGPGAVPARAAGPEGRE